MILTWKQILITLSITAVITAVSLTAGANPVFADHQTASDCQLFSSSAKKSECQEHVRATSEPSSDDFTPDDSSVEAENSNIECGDGGVRVGVGVDTGSGDENCVGGGSGENPIFEYLGGIIRFLSIGVGVVVTAMIVVGGIQYSAAGGNPQAVEAAKSRITNAIIALLLYIFMVGILNFLVPGGVL